MRFWILGPLEVTVEASPVRIPGLRQRRILATLALHANTPVSIDRLVDVLWSETPPRTAREQVQNCAGQLAHRLGEASGLRPISRHGRSYMLNASDDSLDALGLPGVVRRSRELDEAGRPGDAQRVCRAALDLWRGEVLVDVLTDGM